LNQLSTRLKKTRESKNLNRSQIALLLGISSQLYGQYEDGKRVPKTPFFIKWKEKFNEDLIETNVSRETENKHLDMDTESRHTLERTLENLS
jgi:transcriptional regulator with XRE-family HTH domain